MSKLKVGSFYFNTIHKEVIKITKIEPSLIRRNTNSYFYEFVSGIKSYGNSSFEFDSGYYSKLVPMGKLTKASYA